MELKYLRLTQSGGTPTFIRADSIEAIEEWKDSDDFPKQRSFVTVGETTYRLQETPEEILRMMHLLSAGNLSVACVEDGVIVNGLADVDLDNHMKIDTLPNA